MEGAGPAVVLIHDTGQRAEAWNAVMPLLSGAGRMIAVDLPGHGESLPLPEERAAMEDLVAQVAGFLLPFGRAVPVVGQGLGAAIALELAVRRRDLVASVVAVSAVFAPEEPPLAGSETPVSVDPAVEAACRFWAEGTEPGVLARTRALAATHPGPDPDGMARLRCPAVFVTGSGDPQATPAMSQALAALTPQGRALIIDGGGPMVHMTHPGPVAAAILQGLGAEVAA